MDKHQNTLRINSAINYKVEFAMVQHIYAQANMGFLASVICGSIIFIYLYNTNSSSIPLFLWYMFFIVTILLRIILVKSFLKHPNKENNTKLWRNFFTFGASMSGIAWGLIGTPLLLPTNQPLELALMLVILAGISAGAVPLNAYILEAALLFILTALLPLIVHLMLLGNVIFAVFDIAVIVFTIYLVVLTFRTHRLIYHSFYLQFENHGLLDELSEAKKQLEVTNKRLQQAATHDPLTHVANRHLFEVIFQDALNRAEHEKQNLALLYLDLDKFKEVNDTYGHHAGDQLLLVVIARIKNILRDNDTVARIGGDEITIILENATHLETVAEIAQRICQSISKPIKIDHHVEVQICISIGISMYPSDGKEMNKLIEVADRAMYFAKENGGNSFHFNLEPT